MRCPHCQHTIPDGAVYCGACGRRVVGWSAEPHQKRSGPLPDPNVSTRKVPPDRRLLHAARVDPALGQADPALTQKVSPDSHLLRIVRGDPSATRIGAPSPADLQRARPTREQGAWAGTPPPESREGPTVPPDQGPENAGASADPAAVAPGGAAGIEPGVPRVRAPDDPTEPVTPLTHRDHPGPSSAPATSFYLEAALQRRRHRVAALLAADLVLVVVGVYLIDSWAHRPPPPMPLPPTQAPEHHVGYVDWDDDPGGGRIATGPVHAAFSEAPGAARSSRPAARRLPGRPVRRPAVRGRPPARHLASFGPRGRPAAARRASHEQTSPGPRLVSARQRQQFVSAVQRRVRRAQGAIRRCYRQVLRLIHTVRGDVDVEVTIDATGRVSRARAARDTTGSATLVSCILGVFRSLRFPAPPGGPVVLRYPFRFAARVR